MEVLEGRNAPRRAVHGALPARRAIACHSNRNDPAAHKGAWFIDLKPENVHLAG
jgi:hypothetical protein